ncbi:ferredoxin [Rhodococcus sp. KBW08]|uniref:ferredoxin n=1 Tax=Rhodococcus TaxID=1827 RepID=UPI000F5AC2C0|nr:ferredoxin [Rhodococcus sp. KBW08]MDJ0105262.1 ferredoxin [Rhodococcus erythropolis]RQO46851.1 ferredoxin [Rhodococcus sp. KBW08]
MKINVATDRCTGIGICESIAPDFFEVLDDGTLNLLEDKTGDALAEVEHAVRSCPALALSLTEE